MTSEELSKKIRLQAWKMAYEAKASHMGGNFSMADVLAVLYSNIARFDAKNPCDENRDRIVLSKGHCCAVLYATLAHFGFIPEEELANFGENGHMLS